MTPRIIENVRISFRAPLDVTELASKDSNSRKITGMAVPAQKSRNGRTFKLEDLKKAKFNGKPYSEGIMINMGLNHSDDVTDIVGKWNPVFNDGGIAFEGMVYNTGKYPWITDMLDKKLWDSVSVEMMADLVKEDEVVYVKNQDILGLDFVKTPGLPDASVGIAEAFEKAIGASLVQTNEHSAEEIHKGDEKMEKEKIEVKEEEKQEEVQEEVKEEEKEEPKPEIAEEKQESDPLIKETAEKVEELSKAVKKLKESPKSKGKVTQETEPEIVLKIEKKDGKVNIYSEEFLY